MRMCSLLRMGLPIHQATTKVTEANRHVHHFSAIEDGVRSAVGELTTSARRIHHLFNATRVCAVPKHAQWPIETIALEGNVVGTHLIAVARATAGAISTLRGEHLHLRRDDIPDRALDAIFIGILTGGHAPLDIYLRSL